MQHKPIQSKHDLRFLLPLPPELPSEVRRSKAPSLRVAVLGEGAAASPELLDDPDVLTIPFAWR